MPVRPASASLSALVTLTLFAAPAMAGQATPPLAPDIVGSYAETPLAISDYEKRVEMIAMRDGVKLYTVIVVPKGAKDAPMILTRTPYNAAGRAARNDSPYMLDTLPEGDELFVKSGYIRVFQDVRGKYGSEGEYVMTRPPIGPLNDSEVDHTTDAYDTIDWLVKNVPESNGRVGMLGSSYEGFTVVMALLNPHPALKVASPQSPMIDGWMGDDWFQYGAYRQINIDFMASQTTKRGASKRAQREGFDDYTNFLNAVSADGFARAAGLANLPWWKKTTEHPSYDEFWSGQALDPLLAKAPLKVPTMWTQGLWDQEDIWGGVHAYEATEPKDRGNNKNFLVMGPWRHSNQNYAGRELGPFHWEGDTGLQWRRDVLKPFFDQYLVEGAPRADTPPVYIYNTGENHWDRLNSWPLACADCRTKLRPLYLTGGFGLSFEKPEANGAAYDEYVSDPAKPVPYTPRPVKVGDADAWRTWLLRDQRFVDGRPDVLTYMSEPLDAPVRVSGAPIAHLFASTSGTDSDWIVKVIDVYPPTVPSQPELGGYQLPISLAIFRGRYREDFATPTPLRPGAPLEYSFRLPTVNHVFQPGHRIMVQVQSTLFPLYDRNPQTYVENIFFAKPEDFQKATQRVHRAGDTATYVDLPVVAGR